MKKIVSAVLNRLFPSRAKLDAINRELQGIKGLLARQAEHALLQSELQRSAADLRHADPKRLLKYGFKVNSQNAEDGMIHEIFRRIGLTSRVFVEIGVGDGTENNTAFLLASGWTGFWIDGSASFQPTLAGRGDLGSDVLHTHVGFVSRENINPLLERLRVPQEFDLLSLDIDQNTYHIWGALCQHRPRVVVIEYNASLPADVSWVCRYQADRVWDGSHNFSASLKAFENLGRELGYSLVGCDPCGVNAFFVRADLTGDHFCAPFTSENHYERPRYLLGTPTGHPASLLDRPQS
jgi:hypothetical protein